MNQIVNFKLERGNFKAPDFSIWMEELIQAARNQGLTIVIDKARAH